MVVHFCKEPIHEHITVNKESYKTSTWRDSNPRPLSHKACALPLSYHHCSWLNLTSDTSWQHNQLVKSISLFQGKAQRKLILETRLEKKFSSRAQKTNKLRNRARACFFPLSNKGRDSVNISRRSQKRSNLQQQIGRRGQ